MADFARARESGSMAHLENCTPSFARRRKKATFFLLATEECTHDGRRVNEMIHSLTIKRHLISGSKLRYPSHHLLPLTRTHLASRLDHTQTGTHIHTHTHNHPQRRESYNSLSNDRLPISSLHLLRQSPMSPKI